MGRQQATRNAAVWTTQAREVESFLTMKVRALIPQGVNSNQLRETKHRVANPSEGAKPVIDRGETNLRTCRTGRSERRGRVLKELPQNWETRPDNRRVRQGSPGINNRLEASGWESDGLIVAKKAE